MQYKIRHPRTAGLLLVALFVSLTAHASTPDALPLDRATAQVDAEGDSLAAQVMRAMGGQEAWRSLRYLRFNFGVERDGEANVVARHLWDRHSGDYRVEWQQGDTAYVALFNVNTREGRVFAGETELGTEAAARPLEIAYRRFINDTYWLLMPVKLFDPGVNRTYVPDSSDAETGVIQLTFGDVGLTPGDTYWVFVDRASGLVTKWAYVLQGRTDAPPSVLEWTDYETHQAPAGPIQIATRKVGPDRVMLTNGLETPADVPREEFTEL